MRAVEDEEVYEAFLRGEITGIVSTGSTWKAFDVTSLTGTEKNREYFYFDLDEDGKKELIVRTDDVRYAVLKRVKNELLVMFSDNAEDADNHVVRVGEMTGILTHFFWQTTPEEWLWENYSFKRISTEDGSWRNYVYYERGDQNCDGEYDDKDLYLKAEGESKSLYEIDMATWEQEIEAYRDAEWVEKWQTWE